MENPGTWNDTQRAISEVLYKDATNETDLTERFPQVLALLGETKLTVDDINQLIRDHEEAMRQGLCGLSLVGKIWASHSA